MSSGSHFLVGFNEPSPWSAKGDRLFLETGVYERPPVMGDFATVRWADAAGKVHALGETDCWNFPQGARQQWLREGRAVVFNCRINNVPIATLVDAPTGERRRLAAPVYCVTAQRAFGVNFGRLQRLGGYGYAGLVDLTLTEAAPAGDGIWDVPLDGGKATLLVSLAEVAEFDRSDSGAGHHYVTHLQPSPSGARLAFLHRCWLPDGGINTRLLTVDLSSRRLRTWAAGYLSHYDWWDDETIVIWGRANQKLGRMRQTATGLGFLPRPIVHGAKAILRPFLARSAALRCYYLILREDSDAIATLEPDTLTHDGHPSFLPADRRWMLSDTYPDAQGNRNLFLLHWETRRRVPLGTFREAKRPVDTTRLSEATMGIDPVALKNFKPRVFAYNRSGLYCDFHPRWRPDGQEICFDSNHEGRRRIYGMRIPPAVLQGSDVAGPFVPQPWLE